MSLSLLKRKSNEDFTFSHHTFLKTSCDSTKSCLYIEVLNSDLWWLCQTLHSKGQTSSRKNNKQNTFLSRGGLWICMRAFINILIFILRCLLCNTKENQEKEPLKTEKWKILRKVCSPVFLLIDYWRRPRGWNEAEIAFNYQSVQKKKRHSYKCNRIFFFS